MEAGSKSKEDFVSKIQAQAVDPCYSNRHLYLYMCSSLVAELSSSEFRVAFLPHALALCKDKVPNVRISLATFLVTEILPLNDYKADKGVQEALKALFDDQEKQVRDQLQCLKINC